MSSRLAPESVRKVLRRRAQINRLKNVPASLRAAQDERPLDVSPSFEGPSSNLAVSPTPPVRSWLVANRNLQKTFSGILKESELQRQLRRAIDAAHTKAATLDLFFLFARSSGEAISNSSLTALSSSLVKNHVREALGEANYNALREATVGSSDDRWKEVSPEEERCFAMYQRCRLERYEERGTSFNEALGLTLEGSDNNTVSLIEYQIRKRSEDEALPVPTDVLADLMHLDISWSAALRLYEYAKELRGFDPPVEMANRVMSLMTGYRTNGLGSRPWQEALCLYERVCSSGYDVSLATHTAALDALWRRGDTSHRVHHTLSERDKESIWVQLHTVKDRVQQSGLPIIGEDGCAYMEGFVKAVSAAGKWEAAVAILQDLDITTEDTTHRLLVPTAETFLFTMAACHAAGNASHAESVRALFQLHYTLRSAHSEALLVYLQSLRNTVNTCPTIGEQIERLVMDGGGLDRPCALACLQLLSNSRVHHTISKVTLALALFRVYDANAWPQQPLARKIELQTLFRCCHLISSSARKDGDTLVQSVTSHVERVFGPQSPEWEWLRDTEIYLLHDTSDWEKAVDIYHRLVELRPAEHVLPIPVRQVRQMVMEALLRSCRKLSDMEDAESFLLDEDQRDTEKQNVFDVAEKCIDIASRLYAESPASVPHAIVSELQLIQGLQTTDQTLRKSLGVKAMRHLAVSSAEAVTPLHIRMIARVLDLTEEHTESVLLEGHARLRGTALTYPTKGSTRGRPPSSPLERVYL